MPTDQTTPPTPLSGIVSACCYAPIRIAPDPGGPWFLCTKCLQLISARSNRLHTPPTEPGEGWRWLVDKEPIAGTDEAFCPGESPWTAFRFSATGRMMIGLPWNARNFRPTRRRIEQPAPVTPDNICACCTCGYQWERGQDGSHACGETLLKRVRELEEALRAADRLLRGPYAEWATSGGPGQCEHGYAAGIPCPKCDEATMQKALANDLRI